MKVPANSEQSDPTGDDLRDDTDAEQDQDEGSGEL